jgi:hypothetical protein
MRMRSLLRHAAREGPRQNVCDKTKNTLKKHPNLTSAVNLFSLQFPNK